MRIPGNTHLSHFLPRSRVWRHILFWVIVYLLDVIVFGLGYENFQAFFKMALLEMPSQLFFAYGMMYWVVPRYMADKNAFEAISITVVAFFVSGILGNFLFIAFSAYSTEVSLWDFRKITLRAFYCFLKACLFILVKLGMLWYENEKRVAAMEKSRLESELKMLKDQVNPHFMFNTLNNLYGLVTKNPVHAQQSILRLSGILQFMLHESNHATIPLQLELKCIQDYIELEKLRYTDKLSVSVNVQEGLENLAITPLVIFPFVENSFKHGASEAIRDAWVNIDFSVYKDHLVFKIANGKGPRLAPPSTAHGIGLSNVKRRLELIYRNDHALEIMDDTESFLVILKIALTRMERNHSEKYEGEVSNR
jgi:two-component system, LytTR family, sensor kinase